MKDDLTAIQAMPSNMWHYPWPRYDRSIEALREEVQELRAEVDRLKRVLNLVLEGVDDGQ